MRLIQKVLATLCFVGMTSTAHASDRQYVARKLVEANVSTATMIFEARQIIAFAFEDCSRDADVLPESEAEAAHSKCKELLPARTALEQLESQY